MTRLTCEPKASQVEPYIVLLFLFFFGIFFKLVFPEKLIQHSVKHIPVFCW